MKLISRSTKDTDKIASNLALKIIKANRHRYAKVIALEGELGAGKTTFVKSFARAMGIKSHITSPTFVLMKQYALNDKRHALLFHIDAYRLKNYRDLLHLGIKEIVADPKNVVLIEWSERVKPILPKTHIKIHIDHLDLNTRKISILNIK